MPEELKIDATLKPWKLSKFPPLIEHHLLPKFEFSQMYDILRRKNVKTILNMQIRFDVKPTISNILKCRKMRAHIYLERMPIENVEGSFNGLYELFQRKDELMQHFNEKGHFKVSDEIEMVEVKHHENILLNFISWTSFWIVLWTLCGYYLISNGHWSEMIVKNLVATQIFVYYIFDIMQTVIYITVKYLMTMY
jgi:hypothetical protein